MRVAEDEGSEFHDGNEAGKVDDLRIGIAAIDDPGEVEELCALVDFCPKTFLEGFFGGLEGGGLFDQVEVG